MPRVTFNGAPGTVYVNQTGKLEYQFFCSWVNTCGACAQYDRAIGPWWPIPIHRSCRCHQELIIPGASAKPFIDFRAKASGLSPDQQKKLVGASNWKLIESGAVKWDDVVSPMRVRALHEVAALKKLSVQDMLNAGVKSPFAVRAHATVNTPAHVLANQQRAQLVANLRNAGMTPGQITGQVAGKLVQRVQVGGLVGTAGRRTFLGLAVPDLGLALGAGKLLGKLLGKIRAEPAKPTGPETRAREPGDDDELGEGTDDE